MQFLHKQGHKLSIKLLFDIGVELLIIKAYTMFCNFIFVREKVITVKTKFARVPHYP